MIKLEDILSEWKEDSQIPKNQLDECLVKHRVYIISILPYLSETKLRLKRQSLTKRTY